MTPEQEKAFLTKLEPKARRGELTTKAEIKQAFEQQVGHQVHKSTIYGCVAKTWMKSGRSSICTYYSRPLAPAP